MARHGHSSTDEQDKEKNCTQVVLLVLRTHATDHPKCGWTLDCLKPSSCCSAKKEYIPPKLNQLAVTSCSSGHASYHKLHRNVKSQLSSFNSRNDSFLLDSLYLFLLGTSSAIPQCVVGISMAAAMPFLWEL